MEKQTYTYEQAFEASLKYFEGDELAARVWVNKYAVKDSFGNIYEESPEDMHWRIANELARVEKKYPNPLSAQELHDLMDHFKYIVPQGSPMTGIGNDFQNQRTIRFERPNRPWNHQFQWQVTADNLLESCIYVAVRLIPEANWINDRDQFLAPNDQWITDELFQSDCLTFAIFNTKNNVRSSDGPNHWQPFTEKQLGITNSLPSHFMTDFIEGKAVFHTASTTTIFKGTGYHKLTFSEKAQAVFDAALPLWKYYFQQKDSNINATYYNIREFFCGRNKSGKMNAQSADSKYNELHYNLRLAHKELAEQIKEKIYDYEFLIR